MAENDSISPTIEAAENGFMVRPPWNSTEKPVIVPDINAAIAESARMVRDAWDEKGKTFSKNVKDTMDMG